MKRSISLLAAAAIGLGMLAATAAAERRSAEAKAAAPAPSREHIQKTLDALVAAGAPGAVLLMRDGAHRVVMTAGLADTRTRTPMRADDRFRVGSLTKSFIATIVLQLVRERQLTLEDSIEQWLPGSHAHASRRSLHHVPQPKGGPPRRKTQPRDRAVNTFRRRSMLLLPPEHRALFS